MSFPSVLIPHLPEQLLLSCPPHLVDVLPSHQTIILPQNDHSCCIDAVGAQHWTEYQDKKVEKEKIKEEKKRCCSSGSDKQSTNARCCMGDNQQKQQDSLTCTPLSQSQPTENYQTTDDSIGPLRRHPLIVHMGHTCGTRSRMYTVLNVFQNKAIDAQHASDIYLEYVESIRMTNRENKNDAQLSSEVIDMAHVNQLYQRALDVTDTNESDISVSCIPSTSPDKESRSILLVADSIYQHALASIKSTLTESLEAHHIGCNVQVAQMPIILQPISAENQQSSKPVANNACHEVMVYGKIYAFSSPPCIYYIGNSKALSNLLLRYPQLSVYSYRPAKRSFEQESRLSNRLLSKRFYQMNKAKDATVFGILIGTMGASSYLDLLPAIKSFLRLRKRKVYTFAVGKLNVPKLANFPEIDCFVHLSCPDTSILDEDFAKSMYAPVVTPWELLVAIGGHDWSSEYALTFDELIRRLQTAIVLPDEDEPHFSLITGKFRQVAVSSPDCQELTVSDGNNALGFVGNTYSQFRRTWNGLDPAIGETNVEIVSQGRRGIARDYTIER